MLVTGAAPAGQTIPELVICVMQTGWMKLPCSMPCVAQMGLKVA